MPAEDVLEARMSSRRSRRRRGRAATGRRARAVGADALAEEHAEEVGELAGVAGGPELVADVAAGLRSPRDHRSLPVAGCRAAAGPADRLPVRPELVVLLALGGVAEDLVGLVDLLELALGRGVARLRVGVMLAGELAERLLDLSL